MSFQFRLKKVMRRRNMRVADLARHFKVPYMTMREWVLNGRQPQHPKAAKLLSTLEKSA